MIEGSRYPVEPWRISERDLHIDHLAESESIFALSNGHIGLRGNLDEGEPHGVPGTYLNGFFETVPMPHAEAGYGYPEVGQSMIDVANGKLIRLLVDDEPFDVRYGTLNQHHRALDLRAGVLQRDVDWTSPAGRRVLVRSTRLVSFVQRAIAAIRYEVETVDASARIVVQSTLVANEPIPEETDDPRAAAALRAPLVSEFHSHHDLEAALGHHTRGSALRVASAIDHVIEGPGTVTTAESWADLGRVVVSTELEPGTRLRVVKFIGYGWSSERSMPALHDQVDAALAAAKRSGWEGLAQAQRAFLDDVWARADIEVDGDDELQQALRFAIFQVVQSAARAEQRAIPAKGLSARGYDGHTFWDMDSYTLPVLTYIAPEAARDALRWRYSTLPLACARAAELHVGGAAFPWRTIRGEECSGYWPAGTAGFHINAAVADAVHRYVMATGDDEFARGPGLELLVQTARLWRSLGHHDATGSFRIDGVTGPDEYSALVDNNTFTNLMAARSLEIAADAVEQWATEADAIGVRDDEVASWRHAAQTMVVPYDRELGVTSQSEGFTRYRRWNFEKTSDEQYPLLLHYPYYLLYSSQVVKQADLVFALYRCGDRFDAEQKRRDFEYYEPITVRDSSLSASIQAIVAAEVGHLDLAYSYFRETALIDLRNLAGNTDDGLHLAALSGAWLVAVAGFGGLRDYGPSLSFAPRLPAPITRLRFRVLYRGRRLHIEITPEHTRYEVVDGEPLALVHHGESLVVARGEPCFVTSPQPVEVAPVQPPGGREPARPGVGAEAPEPTAR